MAISDATKQHAQDRAGFDVSCTAALDDRSATFAQFVPYGLADDVEGRVRAAMSSVRNEAEEWFVRAMERDQTPAREGVDYG